MSIQFITYNKEETNISEVAKKYFYNLVLNGKPGPFVCEEFNSQRKAIVLVRKETKQKRLF